MSYIYVMASPYFPHVVKIGRSDDPDRRAAELSIGCPGAYIALRHEVDNASALETALHHRFAEHCVGGEWFAISPDDVANHLLVRETREPIEPRGPGLSTELPDIVRDRRKYLGLSQLDLADLAGVSERTVYAIEGGKKTVRLDVLESVIGALGLKLAVERRLGQKP